MKVDFSVLERDREVLRLAALGRPIQYIAFVTRLTPAQVGYRLKRAKVFRLKDIRGGTDKYRILDVAQNHPAVVKEVIQKIDSVLEEERVVVRGQMQGIKK